MKRSDFNFHLPQELIAQVPLVKRDDARLLVYNRAKESITHRHFYDIIEYLNEGDLLVANNSRVMPARLNAKCGERSIEILICKRLGLKNFEILAKPSKRARLNDIFVVNDELSFKIIGKGEYGECVVSFIFEGSFEEVLERAGTVPLPHYIKAELKDAERYQTVYSKEQGSCAAPTAGLHFTQDMLEKLKEKGVLWEETCLHIGTGTFRPVKCEDIEDHKMHTESYFLSERAADAINKAKAEGRRVIAVGTTSLRVLESCAKKKGKVQASEGETNIFIYPPYEFKIVDALITNFHLPESTLIMLVSAFLGREQTLKIYNQAVKEKYRFFSFGDCCFFS